MADRQGIEALARDIAGTILPTDPSYLNLEYVLRRGYAAVGCPPNSASAMCRKLAECQIEDAPEVIPTAVAELRACLRYCESYAALNAREATARGKALSEKQASRDEKCAAMWASHHAANQIAGFIRDRLARLNPHPSARPAPLAREG